MTEPTMTAASIRPLDLAAERAEVGSALDEAVQRVLASGQFVLGPEVEAFEREFAELHGARHGIGVASGTDALVLALKAFGIGPGDAVLTSPFTFFASAGTIAWVGARPVLADVDPETGLLDLEAARAALTPQVRCILPVHLYGQLADVAGFRALADEHGCRLLEDAAQAHGASRDGVHAGELGEAAAYSFYPTKNLGAPGEGGMILVQDDALAARLRRLRDHGSSAKYQHAEVGTNSRLAAVCAAALRVKLPHLEDWNRRRRAIAELYDARFAASEAVRPLARVPGGEHVFHQYAVRVRGDRSRDDVAAALWKREIGVAVHYPRPVHLQEAARDWGWGPGALPAAEALAREVLCLPVHPFLEPADAERVAAALLELAEA